MHKINGMKIFVQIASYRDPELIPTIKNCIEKAKYPENLTFGIAWQHDETESLDEFINDERFKILDIPYTESKGVCWARNKVNLMYSDEEYTLQIDSHMRFIENWDEEVINIWKNLQNDKAILTSYPPEYYPNKPETEWSKNLHIIHTYSFKNGQTQQRPRTPENWENRTTPYRAIHVAAGFIFGKGSYIKDVTYDPEFYFSGEETALAIRFYTHGYDLYHPHKIIVWHYYGRHDSNKHWTDFKDWGKYANVANDRLNCLLKRNNKYDLGIYSLGTERTLEDFQNYSGIDYTRNLLHLDTKDNKEPPVDLTDAYKWSYIIKTCKYTAKWNWDDLDHSKELKFIAFIFKDKGDQEIYRKDIDATECIDILNGTKTEYYFEFEYNSPEQEPKILIIYPYAVDSTWLNLTRQEINIELPKKENINLEQVNDTIVKEIPQNLGNMVLDGHLGGFFDSGDGGTYYPQMWSYLVKRYEIKSVLDVGCGRGYSSLYFKSLGCNITGVDGSKKAQELSLIPDDFILNDYTLGSAIKEEKFDLIWCCEFVEHIEEKYISNFLKDFQKGKYLAMTFAGLNQAGHHHVNCNTKEYWVNIMEKNGFFFLSEHTMNLIEHAKLDKMKTTSKTSIRFDFHFIERGLFFINSKY